MQSKDCWHAIEMTVGRCVLEKEVMRRSGGSADSVCLKDLDCGSVDWTKSRAGIAPEIRTIYGPLWS